jgi:hypothetical protein
VQRYTFFRSLQYVASFNVRVGLVKC